MSWTEVGIIVLAVWVAAAIGVAVLAGRSMAIGSREDSEAEKEKRDE